MLQSRPNPWKIQDVDKEMKTKSPAPCTNRVLRTPQPDRLAFVMKILKVWKENFPDSTASFSSHQARDNLVLSAKLIDLLRYLMYLSHKRILHCRDLEWN